MLRILSYILVFSLVMTAGLPDAAAKSKKSKTNDKYASLIMDADTGVILSQRYADKKLHPASLTKMMTMLMAFEALDRGDIKKSDRIRMSERAAGMQPSKLGLPAGQSLKVDEALYILATKSANDVAVAMAEFLGGSESKFAAMMTARAHSIGMSNTNFRNASGLHDKYQVSTARDMAKLGRYILQRYPHYYTYFSTQNYTWHGQSFRNHNRLMSSYQGMDGFKTGYINASGFNLVASAKRDGRRLIGVVFGGYTTKSRNDHMATLLDAGFKKAGEIRIARVANPPVPTTKPVYGLSSMTAQADIPANIAAQALQQPAQMAQNNINSQINFQGAKQEQTFTQTGYTSLAALNTNTKIVSNNPATPNREVNVSPNYTAISEAMQEGTFGEMLGEGDIDPAMAKRLETGIIAMAVLKGDYDSNLIEEKVAMAQPAQSAERVNVGGISHLAPSAAPTAPKEQWAVQIGAFTNMKATDSAIRQAVKKLPSHLSNASPQTVPLRTNDGTIYRARLSDMSEKQARQACRYLNDCMVIAPINPRVGTR